MTHPGPEPLSDCHCHAFDPGGSRTPLTRTTRPTGAEIGTPAQLGRVFDAHGVAGALVVGPNSAYGEDHNACLLDTIAGGGGWYRGMAVVSTDVDAPSRSAWRPRGSSGSRTTGRCSRLDHLVPDPTDRRQIMWTTPRRLYGLTP